MFQPIWKAIERQFSGQAAWDETAEIHRHDRLSTASAYARTADHVAARLRDLGLVDVERIPFKADGRTLLGDWLPSPAWDAEEAELEIVEPADLAGLLCRYPENPACLGMNSAGTPPGGLTGPLVDPAAVKSRSRLKGAFVLTGERPRAVRERYAPLGVVGIVSDCKPGYDDFDRRYTQPEGTYWENVWHEPWERPRMPVFKIPPRTADRLRAALKAGKKITVRARVRARNYAGRIDNVTAVIPGRSRREEIVVVGHVYEVGANDNASGAGAMLEMARALVALIRRRAIPPPRRSIRLLFPWECYGSLAYVLSRTARRHAMLAGINPDMLGNDPALCGSAMEVSRVPDCCPSPANAFVDRLFRTLAARFPTYGWGWTGPANDDGLFFSDPAIGAGTPTLTMWPDRFYHSNQDTMDKVSTRSLHQAGTVMGTYAAFLAAAGRREALWLANEVYRFSSDRIERLVASVVEADIVAHPPSGVTAAPPRAGAPHDEHTATPAERLAWLRDRSIEHLRSVTRFVPERQRPALLKQLGRFETLIKVDAVGAVERVGALRGSAAVGDERPVLPRLAGAYLVPRRRARSAPAFDGLSAAERKAFTEARTGGLPGGTRAAMLVYLADGRRTVADINRFLRGEFGSSNLRHLVNTYRLLDRFGYVKLASGRGR